MKKVGNFGDSFLDFVVDVFMPGMLVLLCVAAVLATIIGLAVIGGTAIDWIIDKIDKTAYQRYEAFYDECIAADVFTPRQCREDARLIVAED